MMGTVTMYGVQVVHCPIPGVSIYYVANGNRPPSVVECTICTAVLGSPREQAA